MVLRLKLSSDNKPSDCDVYEIIIETWCQDVKVRSTIKDVAISDQLDILID